MGSRSGHDEELGRDQPPALPDTEPVAPGDPRIPANVVLPPRFETVRVLGRGGMGIVLEVRDRSLNREVAVKILASERLVDDEGRSRFLREARAAATLHHPNIVTVFDIDPACEYLVMELVGGESLAKRLHREGRFAPEEVRRIGVALLGALSAAHRAGIVHRDVKPSNVLVDPRGVIKLTDFGVASFGDSELTSTGQLIGTPQYMAPEQLRGRHVDERADVYAAGATLFEAATGRRLNGQSGRPDDPGAEVLEATGDAALASAIGTAVEEKESLRFSDAEDFARALVEGAPKRQSAGKEAPRRRRHLVSALLALLTLAVLGVFFGMAMVLIPRSAEEESRSGANKTVKVALLPFSDRTQDARLDFARAGLPNLLGSELQRDGSLQVVGYYRLLDRVADAEADLKDWLEAARALGADVMVRGEIAPAEGGVRLALLVEDAGGEEIDRIERSVEVDRLPETVRSLAPALASAALGAPSTLEPGEARVFEVERELQLGIAALERQDFDEARRRLRAAVGLEDDLTEAHYYLAVLYWWTSEGPEEGLKAIERALASDSLPELERAFMRGLELLVEMEYPEAVDYFRELSERAAEHRYVQYGLFEALFHGGHPTQAVRVYRRLRKQSPRFRLGIKHPLEYYVARGDQEGVRWTLEQWESTGVERFLWEARALAASRRYREAIRLLEETTEGQVLESPPVARELVKLYAADGQLGLSRDLADRLADRDVGFQAIARFGLAIARGDRTGTQTWRKRAEHAAALGFPDGKPWDAQLALAALEAPWVSKEALQDLAGPGPIELAGSNVELDAGKGILAGALGDDVAIELCRESHFPEVAAIGDAFSARWAGDHAAAARAWRRALAHSAEGHLRGIEWFELARDLRELEEQSDLIAACDEVIRPRLFTWAWASTVGPCLRWSAEAAEALDRGAEALEHWRQLLAVRSAAPPSDPLIRAARRALAGR